MNTREFPKTERENTSSGPTKCSAQNIRKDSHIDT